MTQIETVQFRCPTCEKSLRAKAEQAGRVYACPGCGGAVEVPRIETAAAQAAPSTSEPAPESAEPGGFLTRVPASVGELAIVLFVLWSIVAFVSLIAVFFGSIAAYVGLIMFLLATIVAAQQAWQLLRAPQTVLTIKEVPLFWGTVRLIAWEPTEGVLILRNKAMTFRDDNLEDGKGGVRFIYPFLGEEVALRVPLETQTLHFADDNVLTREYLHLGIRGTMKWRITDITKFYLLVSRELRTTKDPADGHRATTSQAAGQVTARLVDATIGWLRALAEEQTRQVVSRVKSGLLIADKLMADLPEARQAALAQPAEFGGAADGLASAIHDLVSERLKDYGISVSEVSLQEIRMPDEIVKQCVEAARTAYLPLIAQRQASARHAELKAEVDVLGKENVAAREIVSNSPAYALRDFLTEFVTSHAASATNAKATIDVSKLAAIEAAATPQAALEAPRDATTNE